MTPPTSSGQELPPRWRPPNKIHRRHPLSSPGPPQRTKLSPACNGSVPTRWSRTASATTVHLSAPPRRPPDHAGRDNHPGASRICCWSAITVSHALQQLPVGEPLPRPQLLAPPPPLDFPHASPRPPEPSLQRPSRRPLVRHPRRCVATDCLRAVTPNGPPFGATIHDVTSATNAILSAQPEASRRAAAVAQVAI